MAYSHQRKTGQVAIGYELVELALPFVVAPQVRIVLVIAAEVDVGQRGERRIERCDLHLAGGERIDHRRPVNDDSANVVHQEPVVPDGTTSSQHRVEDVAILDTEGSIGRGVVPRAGQYIGCTSRQTRSGG